MCSSYFKSTLDLTSLTHSKGIKVFPNPITDNEIYISGINANSNIYLIDIQGIKRKLTQTMETYISLPTLASGVYILEIVQENETQLFKIIKN
jgi:hypothetical protein